MERQNNPGNEIESNVTTESVNSCSDENSFITWKTIRVKRFFDDKDTVGNASTWKETNSTVKINIYHTFSFPTKLITKVDDILIDG